MKQLPDGWRWVKLGELCDLVNGDAYRDTDWSTSGVPIIRIQNLNNPTKPFNYWAESLDDRVIVNSGDVLLAWSGTPGTSFGTHRWNRGLGVLNQHIFRVDLNLDRIDPDWAVYAINEQLDEMIGKAHGGVGLRHVTKGEVEKLEILLPSLPEQRRIAGVLREQMAAVDAARRSAEVQQEAAQALPAAYLRATFDSVEAKQWPTKRIGDVAKTCSGSTPARGQSEYYRGGIPWVKTGELRDCVIIDTEEHVTELAIRECSLTLLPAQTLLVAMYGQGQTRGRTGLLQQPATTNQACFAILPQPDVYDSVFLQCWFRHNYERLRRETEGRGGNQSNLNGEVLREQQIPLAPLSDQRRIAAELTEKLAGVERLRHELAEQLAAIEALPAALLRRAFAGEL